MSVDQIVARVYQPFGGGKTYEQALLVTWFLVIGLPIAGMTPFRYLFILYFLSFFLFETRNILTGVATSWWLIPFQCVAFLSYFWSPYASEALREGILLILSTVVIIVVASRFTPDQIIRCMLISSAVVLVYIIAQPIPIVHGASFGSKNYAALFMLTGFILSLSTSLNPKELKLIRLFGLVIAPVFAYLVVAAQSTTALFMLAISGALIIGMRMFFLDAREVRNLSALLLVMGLFLIVGVIYAALIFVDQQLIDSFLGAFGKDSSFTGRTALWEEAENQISQRPYLGVGLEGFWQYDVGSAQTLNENDHKPLGTRLTFHNVHLEVLVHLGVIGYSLFVMSILAVIWFTAKRLFTRADMPAIAFSTGIVISLISSFVESSLWSGFNIQAFLFFVSGAVYARGDRRRYIGNMVATPEVEPAPTASPVPA